MLRFLEILFWKFLPIQKKSLNVKGAWVIIYFEVLANAGLNILIYYGFTEAPIRSSFHFKIGVLKNFAVFAGRQWNLRSFTSLLQYHLLRMLDRTRRSDI